jgi:hypothetical protein
MGYDKLSMKKSNKTPFNDKQEASSDKGDQSHEFIDRFIEGLSKEEKTYACDKLQSAINEEDGESESPMIDMEKLKSSDFDLTDKSDDAEELDDEA